jgi:putative drug exporter of the RND superfamily
MTKTTAVQPSELKARRSSRYVALITGKRSRWVVLVFWLLLLGFGGTLGSKIGSVQNDEAKTWLPANAQSTHAVKIAEQHFADKNIITAVVVYARSSGLTAADRAKVEDDRNTLTLDHTAAAPISTITVSQDRQAAILTVPLHASKSDDTVLGHAVDHVRNIAASKGPSGLDVRIAGEAGNASDFIHAFAGLNGALLGATIGVVAILLLLTYRSPVLWLVPLLSVGLASQVASGLVYLLAKSAGLLVNGQSASILTVLVFGVGTDYALLLVSRYREELHRHTDRHQAMALALRRCLPAVTASAGTVVIATMCLSFGSMNSTRGLGPVCAIGVAVAYLAMTTLLPALLVTFGRRVFWPAIPKFSLGTGPSTAGASVPSEHRFWSRIARGVGRAPRPLWIGAVLVLGALAFGSTTLSMGQTQADQFTKTVDSVVGQQLLAKHFAAGSSAPADIYTRTSAAPGVITAARTVDGIAGVRTVGSSGGWTHAVAVLNAQPDTHAAQDAVQRLRDRLHSLPGSGALVGGQSAVALDTARAQSSEEKLLIPLILAVVLIMLILLLRAIVAPVVLLLSVVLSYAAAVGTAALLFHALGHPHIDRSLLLMGFLFLVALGVDYTIFLMTRAREEVERRGHRDGVLTGLAVTGGVITSAGLVLAATFSVLAVLPVVSSLQQGALVAVGVILDTFIVRSLLVPAVSLDIGLRMWWPSKLARAKQPLDVGDS